ncbi:PREDICTED: terminal [Prunus dulcis]|uniref:PREDICTED: terminal n=1 Tax=Prunus dulcis TaxID=3755 RepID=A0A5E4EIK0_PRUDU|nr:PREDICTED: terminal [Prunus dulcis]
MSSKALNPKAPPFFLNKTETYVSKRYFYPLQPPYAFQNLHQPIYYFCHWRQPNFPNPKTIVSLKQNMEAAAAAKTTKRVPRENVYKGKRGFVSARLRKSLKELGDDHQVVGACRVVKWLPKKEVLEAEKGKKAWRQRIIRGTKARLVNAGCGDVIPFPSSPDVQNGSSTTTIMIKNIPNQFQRGDLLSFLSKHCCAENIKACMNSDDPIKSEFDFVYLPMDFQRAANLGYAFVNFTSTVAASRFYKKFHEKMWEEVSSNNKTREVTCAKLQGLEALRGHFKKKAFWCDTEEYLPVILEPPCDGGVELPNLKTVGKCVGVPSAFGNSPTHMP